MSSQGARLHDCTTARLLAARLRGTPLLFSVAACVSSQSNPSAADSTVTMPAECANVRRPMLNCPGTEKSGELTLPFDAQSHTSLSVGLVGVHLAAKVCDASQSRWRRAAAAPLPLRPRPHRVQSCRRTDVTVHRTLNHTRLVRPKALAECARKLCAAAAAPPAASLAKHGAHSTRDFALSAGWMRADGGSTNKTLILVLPAS